LTPAAPSDPPLKHCQVGGHAVAWSDEGPQNAPTLLCLPGLPGSHRDFRWLAPACVTRFRLLRVDFPGFGDSPDWGLPLDEAGRAAVAVAVLDAAGVDRCVAVGHSVGGAVATAMAAQWPDRVAAVALLASPGARPHRGFRLMPFRMAVGAMDRSWSRGLALALTRRLYVAAGFPRSLTDTQIEATSRCAALVDFPAHGERVRTQNKAGLPTLVAWADDDRIVEPDISLELAAMAAPGPRLHFPTGGHNIQKTQAVELAAALSELWEAAGV
jgi:pimeloyl-ACP methyl ester carboxylesterase